jgi:hypothetical protein
VGVAVIFAMGAAAVVAAGAVSAFESGASFFLQPATATRATNRATGIRMRDRRFNGILLPKTRDCLPGDPSLCICASAVVKSGAPSGAEEQNAEPASQSATTFQNEAAVNFANVSMIVESIGKL